MNCQLCSKEITSQLTGELCTSCYFSKGKESGPIWDKKTADLSNINSNIKNLLEGDSNVIPNQISEQTNSEARRTNLRAEIVDSTQGRNDSEPEGTESNSEDAIKHIPSKSNNQSKDNSIKYCQSCLERGFGLVPATREWREDYFICDECFEPLLNNIIHPNDEQLKTIRTSPEIDFDKPLLNQFYEILGIPSALQFNRNDEVLKSRNDIFNYHAPALINKDIKTVANEIEQLQVMLFQIKIAIEPRQDYINKLKHSEREKGQLNSIEKGKKEVGKIKSKVSQSADQKMADVLFKSTISDPAERLKKYLEMQKVSGEMEAKKKLDEFNRKIS